MNDKNLEYYMKQPYKIVIEADPDDGGFVASCPELKGCITCAETQEEALCMINGAKEEWFAACIEDNIQIPEPLATNGYSGQFKLRIPKSLHRELASRASDEGVSMNQFCVFLLSKGLDTVK